MESSGPPPIDPRSLALFGGGSSRSDEWITRLRAVAPKRARYESPQEIARGGMGAILRVRDCVIGRDLAMKVMRDASAERFLDEAAIAGQLDHPGIVPVHELGVDADDRLFFTMRLIEGHTFGDAIGWVARGERGFTLVRAIEVLRRACEAVAHAHRRGVIHRDLKPSNVMIGNFGETYVVDWGLARASDSPESAPMAHAGRTGSGSGSSGLRTLHGSVLGTPSYMAPEQAAGRLDEIGTASDVYSAGAMLYHLLAGHPPYEDVPGASASAGALVAAVREGPPTPIARRARTAAPELVAICEKAMRRAPPERYADMGELAADLGAFLENRTVRAHRTGALVELRKWIARNRTAAAAAAVALLAALGGMGTVAAITTAKNRQLADANGEAQARYDEVARLSALKRLHDLDREADTIWPATRAQVPAMERWLAQARELVADRERHAATIASLASGASPASSGSLDPAFATWWREALAELLRGIDGLAAASPERVGSIAEMERRRERAATLQQRSLDDHEEEWRDAIAAVESEPRYAGLALKPQLGLAPLGADPESGLQEFWQVDSGEPPARDPATERLRMTDASAIVFVLLPGGTFRYGAQSNRPLALNYDRDARPDDEPVTIDLAPFLLSKFEMTQGQWLRLTGGNPSHHQPGSNSFCLLHHTLLHPVEGITWREASSAVRRLGLQLPTGAQWEYGARSGTTTPYPTGATPLTLRGSENLADWSFVKFHQLADRPDAVAWDDGFPCSAPVGSFAADAFGLHDMEGNVCEFCRDRSVVLHVDAEFTLGDAEQRPVNGKAASSERVHRGSSFATHAFEARSAYETSVPEDASDEHDGLRPARALDR